jgi:hypothetical protein
LELLEALDFIRKNFAPVEIETVDAESESLITLKKEDIPVHEVLNAIGDQIGMSGGVQTGLSFFLLERGLIHQVMSLISFRQGCGTS